MITDIQQATQYFPKKAVVGQIKPARLKYFLLGPPKWGKTKFFSGCPNCLLLAFEEGHFFARCPKVVITDWKVPLKDQGVHEDADGIKYASAMEMLEALEIAARHRELPYSMIIIDTVDIATKMCTDYECNLAKIAYPSDGGDYGKGYELFQTSPFRRFYNRLVKLGVGVACTTHTKEGWYKDKFKQDVYRRESSLPGGIQKFIHSQSDCIIHGFFGKWRKNQPDRDRVISFDGSDEIMAGTRLNTEVFIPKKYIVTPPTLQTPNAPWEQWESFFKDNPHAGELAEQNYRQVTKTRVEVEEDQEPETKPTTTTNQGAQPHA